MFVCCCTFSLQHLQISRKTRLRMVAVMIFLCRYFVRFVTISMRTLMFAKGMTDLLSLALCLL